MVEAEEKGNPKRVENAKRCIEKKEAVVCDNCEQWIYRTCTGIPPEA